MKWFQWVRKTIHVLILFSGLLGILLWWMYAICRFSKMCDSWGWLWENILKQFTIGVQNIPHKLMLWISPFPPLIGLYPCEHICWFRNLDDSDHCRDANAHKKEWNKKNETKYAQINTPQKPTDGSERNRSMLWDTYHKLRDQHVANYSTDTPF